MNKKVKRALIISGVVIATAGIAVVITGAVMDNTGVTYTLDDDAKPKDIGSDIVKVKDSNLPGVTISHGTSSTRKDEFKVQVFTDLHLDHYQEECNYTFSMLSRNIMKEQPDLVVFCGDNITSSFNKPRTKQFAELFEKLGVYWTAVLGNHEKNASNPFCISRNRMINIWTEYPHCLIDNSTKTYDNGKTVWGVGNHVVNLKGENGVVQSLFLLDSGTEMSKAQMKEYAEEIKWMKDNGKSSQTETEFYDHIKDSQVGWYKETFKKIKDLNQGNEPHSTIFSHVPLKEQEDVYVSLFKDEMKIEQGIATNNNLYPYTDFAQDKAIKVEDYNKNGFIKNSDNDTTARMIRRESVCYSPHDVRYTSDTKHEHTPVFDAMKEGGMTNNVFFAGHDHSNNYVVKSEGVILGYVQPGCYSSNNLFSNTMMGNDPYVEPEQGLKENLDGHLIQGYSQVIYKASNGNEKNIISSLIQKENHTIWGKDLYKRAVDLTALNRKRKNKTYEGLREERMSKKDEDTGEFIKRYHEELELN